MLHAGAPLLLWAALSGPAPPAAPPPTISDEITVTATRTEARAGETAAGVTVLGREELAESAAATLDDALRQVPGFTLFRRTGSRAANPTTQGASLRGIGGSAASRVAVLADGVPVNDPFGGWVAWGRVPRLALERVEVLRGGASDLWGSPALAGAVQLIRRDPAAPALLVEASGGSQGTAEASLFAAGRRGAWAASLAAEGFETDGYFLLAGPERGAVDARAGARHAAAEATVARELEGGRWFLRGSFFDEDRDNGTRLQENATTLRRAEAGLDRRRGGLAWAARAWAGSQDYHQTFTAVADDRESERLVRVQDVPAEEWGLSLQAERAFAPERGPAHLLVAGEDLRAVEGTSFEIAAAAPGAPRSRAGGEQTSGGVFVEDLVSLSPRLSLTAALRWDGWTNGEEGGGQERSATAVSPRVSLVYRLRDDLALSAAAYRSFRAPTLNELYRGFRVGDVVTLPNEELGPERLTGVEAGTVYTVPSGPGGRLRLRGTLFWMELEDPVANVTVGEDGGTLLRRRENLGRTRSRGFEAEGEARLGRRFTVSTGLLFADSEVRSFPADPSLEGLRVPQVPRWQGSLGVRFGDPDPGRGPGTAALLARWAGDQLDDDRNRFELGGFFLVDAYASRPLGRGVSAFLAVENLFDERIEAGRTPVATLGPPRLARVGVRWDVASRNPPLPH
jgi:outer membrane receptor protein involved in Fe transport